MSAKLSFPGEGSGRAFQEQRKEGRQEVRGDIIHVSERLTCRWRGATPAFAAWAKRMEAPQLLERCEKAAGR